MVAGLEVRVVAFDDLAQGAADHDLARRHPLAEERPATTHQHPDVGIEGKIEAFGEELLQPQFGQRGLDDLEVVFRRQALGLAAK